MKSNYKKKWVWPLARVAFRNLGLPFNISVTAEASDFKFGIQLGFAKAHHKIIPREKSGHGFGIGELPQNFGVSL